MTQVMTLTQAIEELKGTQYEIDEDQTEQIDGEYFYYVPNLGHCTDKQIISIALINSDEN